MSRGPWMRYGGRMHFRKDLRWRGVPRADKTSWTTLILFRRGSFNTPLHHRGLNNTGNHRWLRLWRYDCYRRTGLDTKWRGSLHRVQRWWYDAYVRGSSLITWGEITGSIRERRRRRNHISFVVGRPALLLERRKRLLRLNIHIRAGDHWNLGERHLDRRGCGYDRREVGRRCPVVSIRWNNRCGLWYETRGKRLLSMSIHDRYGRGTKDRWWWHSRSSETL